MKNQIKDFSKKDKHRADGWNYSTKYSYIRNTKDMKPDLLDEEADVKPPKNKVKMTRSGSGLIAGGNVGNLVKSLRSKGLSNDAIIRKIKVMISKESSYSKQSILVLLDRYLREK